MNSVSDVHTLAQLNSNNITHLKHSNLCITHLFSFPTMDGVPAYVTSQLISLKYLIHIIPYQYVNKTHIFSYHI